MLPSSASRTWCSLICPGRQPWCVTRSTALITMPGVQKPHCRPWQVLNAACIGCSVPSAAARPSIVVTTAPWACTASRLQLLVAWPAMCTVQAPHCPVSQPTWVPVKRSVSRMKLTSSVCGSTSRVTDSPLTVSVICRPMRVSPRVGDGRYSQRSAWRDTLMLGITGARRIKAQTPMNAQAYRGGQGPSYALRLLTHADKLPANAGRTISNPSHLHRHGQR